jgi:tetratricopeptide (TPR) repeat protein
VGRNDACPCGSGRRYKACHGALGVASQTARAPQAPASSPGTPASPAANAPNADALVQRGIDAHRRGALEQAAADYRAALAIVPRHPYALHYLGVVDYQQGRPAQALAALEQSVLAQPREAEFHNNLGLALAALDRDEEAAATFRHALALRPGHAGAWNNLGLALRARNRIDEAIDAFRHALELAPAFTEARWNTALALLSAGRFEAGWEAYEARLSVPAFAPRERPATPRWDGRDPGGRTLLLVAEQGLGDAIHFARFARDLAAQGARVLLRAPGSLANLLQTAPGVAAVSPVDTPWPAHDAWLPLLSLGQTLKVGSVPAHEVPYLRADAGLRSAVRARLGAAEGTRRIGIAWAGNPGNTNDRRRSIALERLAPLFALPGIAWYSLQKDDASLPPAAVDRVHAGLVRLPWRNDFDGLAAMVDELDLVVSVDTSVAHLAGALGRPALVLLPFAGDWRWGLAGERTAWYPTLRLFRQAAPGDWTGAIDAVAAVLATPGAKPSRAG